MDGFLPLIEAFLAFALTILALTTAVSALVGTFQRLLRWRPRVLRGLIEFFYRNDVQDLVTEIWEEHKAANQAAAGAGLSPELLSFVNDPGADEFRRRFIAHMTLMPTVLLGQGGKPDRLAREKAVQKTEAADFGKPIAWWKGWESLKHGVDRLSDEDFMTRLQSSLPGRAISALRANNAEETLAALKKNFDSTGNAAMDLFQKRSRKWSVAVGFLLALILNIDALFLMNSYLTDESLRLRIIEERNTIVQDAGKSAEEVAAAKATVSKEAVQLTERVTAAADTLKKVAASAQGAAESLPFDDIEKSVEELNSSLAGFQSTMDTAVETAGAIQQATGEVQGIAQSLTQSFPIGWTLFPNCTRPNEDVRCRRAADRADGKGFWSGLNYVRKYDTAGLIKWAIGVLITGLMVGLGTPFWIQVVNGALAARRFARGGGQKQ